MCGGRENIGDESKKLREKDGGQRKIETERVSERVREKVCTCCVCGKRKRKRKTHRNLQPLVIDLYSTFEYNGEPENALIALTRGCRLERAALKKWSSHGNSHGRNRLFH